MNTLKLSLFPILFMYHLIRFLLTKQSIISTTPKLHGTNTMTFSPFSNWIQQQAIPQLVKMDHGSFKQILEHLATDCNELEQEICGAKLFYVQALRCQKLTESKFPHQREMIKDQIAYLLKEYVRTQELLELHLQAELNAGDNYRNRLEAIFAQSN